MLKIHLEIVEHWLFRLVLYSRVNMCGPRLKICTAKLFRIVHFSASQILFFRYYPGKRELSPAHCLIAHVVWLDIADNGVFLVSYRTVVKPRNNNNTNNELC